MAIMPLLIKLVKFSVFSIYQIKENGRGSAEPPSCVAAMSRSTCRYYFLLALS